MSFLDQRFLNNSVQTWAIAVAIAIGVYVVLRIAFRVAINRLVAWSKRTKTTWDDLVVAVLEHTKGFFLFAVGIYFAAKSLTMGSTLDKFFDRAIVILVLLQCGIWTGAGLKAWIADYRKRELQDDPASVTTVNALGFIGRLLVWTAVLLLVLANLGININALIAGASVSGVAVAFALQNILGDLFASMSIVLDKPFVIGDFIIVDDHPGNIENIGLKSTRVRSLWGEQLVFSNSDLLKSRIRNFGRMFQRRIVFTLGVTYQTPREKLEKIPGIIKNAIEAQDKTRFDRSHFAKYGDFSLNFESVFYVLSPDYTTYMDIQQAIYLKIHEEFEKEGIEFAYPTQTLFLEKESGS